MKTVWKRTATISVIALGIVLLLSAKFWIPPFLYAIASFKAVLSRPAIVMSLTSPDGGYEAYVRDGPSADGPNQSLYIERNDKIHFHYVAHLAGDVDSIRDIKWAPDGGVVVFQTRDFLIATKVPEYQTVKIYLGREWRRTKPNRRSTFTSGGQFRRIKALNFPEPGIIQYQLTDSPDLHRIDMNSLVTLMDTENGTNRELISALDQF
jgi:hypothetical protein